MCIKRPFPFPGENFWVRSESHFLFPHLSSCQWVNTPHRLILPLNTTLGSLHPFCDTNGFNHNAFILKVMMFLFVFSVKLAVLIEVTLNIASLRSRAVSVTASFSGRPPKERSNALPNTLREQNTHNETMFGAGINRYRCKPAQTGQGNEGVEGAASLFKRFFLLRFFFFFYWLLLFWLAEVPYHVVT